MYRYRKQLFWRQPMLKVKANLFAIPIRIVRNTSKNSFNSQWAKIVNDKTGETLHTGQIDYIRRIAKKRYNIDVKL